MSLIISSGGHVYDRTSGTWEGSTQGSVGDGVDRSVASRAGTVWHNANGVVGVQLNNPGTPTRTSSGSGSGSANNGVPGKGSAGGTGPGAAGVVAATPGNRGAFRSQLTVSLPYDDPSKIIPLAVGGRMLAHDAGWSSIADWEERTGDSEFLSPTWFASWGVASADVWANMSTENAGPLKTRKIQQDLYNAPGVLGDALTTIGKGFLDARAAGRDPFGPDHRMPGFATGGF